MKSTKWIAASGVLVLTTVFTVPAFAASASLQEGGYWLHETSIVVNGTSTYTPYVFASKDPNSGVITTFIPIWYIMQVMKQTGVNNSWNGNKHVLTLTGKNASLSIHDKRGNASIVLNGKIMESGVPSFAVKDPNSGKLTTFFGLYYAEKMLNSLGFSNVWNGTKHTWTISLPSTVANTQSGNQAQWKQHNGGNGQKGNGETSQSGSAPGGGTWAN